MIARLAEGEGGEVKQGAQGAGEGGMVKVIDVKMKEVELKEVDVSEVNRKKIEVKEVQVDVVEVTEDTVREVHNEKGGEVWYQGVCKWFNPAKGWGFLNLVPTKEEVEKKEEPNGEEGREGEGEEEGKGEGMNERLDVVPCGDIFCHQSVILREGFRALEPGERVQFMATRWGGCVIST